MQGAPDLARRLLSNVAMGLKPTTILIDLSAGGRLVRSDVAALRRDLIAQGAEVLSPLRSLAAVRRRLVRDPAPVVLCVHVAGPYAHACPALLEAVLEDARGFRAPLRTIAVATGADAFEQAALLACDIRVASRSDFIRALPLVFASIDATAHGVATHTLPPERRPHPLARISVQTWLASDIVHGPLDDRADMDVFGRHAARHAAVPDRFTRSEWSLSRWNDAISRHADPGICGPGPEQTDSDCEDAEPSP